LSDRPDRFPSLRQAFVAGDSGAARPVQVRDAWPHKGRFVLKLEGVDSIDEAERYRGLDLRIPEEDLSALPEGSYYHHQLRDLRTFTEDRHRTVDDAPFGGGPGMVMKAEPFFRACEAVLPAGPGPRDAVVLLSPRGVPFDQATAERYAQLDRLVLLCGRYEGIDERVRAGIATEEVSLGDFVLTGGEVAALAVIEAVVRLIPGALGDEDSAGADSS